MKKIMNFIEEKFGKDCSIHCGKVKNYFWVRFNNYVLIDDEPVNTVVISAVNDCYDVLFCYNFNLKEDVKYCYKSLKLNEVQNAINLAFNEKQFAWQHEKRVKINSLFFVLLIEIFFAYNFVGII